MKKASDGLKEVEKGERKSWRVRSVESEVDAVLDLEFSEWICGWVLFGQEHLKVGLVRRKKQEEEVETAIGGAIRVLSAHDSASRPDLNLIKQRPTL